MTAINKMVLPGGIAFDLIGKFIELAELIHRRLDVGKRADIFQINRILDRLSIGVDRMGGHAIQASKALVT